MALNLSYMVRETGSNLRRNPTLTLATVINVGVSLFLVGASLIIGIGAKNTTRQFQGGVELVVFLKPQISAAQTNAVGSYIDKNPLVKRKSYLDKHAAYKDFKTVFKDDPETVQAVSPSDVPTSFRVVPKDATVDTVEQLQLVFQQQPGVFRVTAATDSVRKFQRLSDLMKTVSGVTAAFLLAAALLLIFNTIRMAALARRREIEVMKLVGATNWFIRIPFMLEGLAQGLVGAAFAAAGVFGLNELFKKRLGNQGLNFLLGFVVDRNHVIGTSLLLVVIGVLVGVVGSGFAVGRFVDV